MGVAARALRDCGRARKSKRNGHGKAGSVLKSVGIEVRKQMPDGAFLELFVVVDKDWQHRADRVERLGY